MPDTTPNAPTWPPPAADPVTLLEVLHWPGVAENLRMVAAGARHHAAALEIVLRSVELQDAIPAEYLVRGADGITPLRINWQDLNKAVSRPDPWCDRTGRGTLDLLRLVLSLAGPGRPVPLGYYLDRLDDYHADLLARGIRQATGNAEAWAGHVDTAAPKAVTPAEPGAWDDGAVRDAVRRSIS